jgi:hypothetical protein
MILRRTPSPLLSLLVLPLLFSLAGCSSLKTIGILPAAGSAVLTAVGQTVQFSAYGESVMGSNAPTTSNITTSVTWTVSNPSVATINANGIATAVGAGYTEIYAASDGLVASSDLTVTIASSTSGGSSTPYIDITPATATETFLGETTQFAATGSLTGTGSAQNLTAQVQWTSSNAQVATISSSGLASAVGSGTTTIIAQSGGVIATASITVTTNVAANTPTLTLIPSANATATFTGETTQFIALGNLAGGVATQNLTNSVAWSSSDVAVATIDQNGLATAVAANITSSVVTTITAIGSTSTGSLITATATLTALPAGGSVILPTLAVYEVGTGTGIVTSSPGTIVCGSSAPGAECTGNYPANTVVTLTATPSSNSVFGGWGKGCQSNPSPLQCMLYPMTDNTTIGAVFNP